MHFTQSIALSALTGLVAAQSSSTSSAAGSTSTAAAGTANTHIVSVGSTNGSIGFFPNNIQALKGDYVQFQFHAMNYSVAQASFDSPCTPSQNNPSAFWSGYMPAKNEILTYTVPVVDSNPVYFYSATGSDCQSGMVGSINAPSSGTGSLQAFSQAASKATSNVTPGQASASSSSSGSSSSSSSGSSSSSSSSATTTTGSPTTSASSNANTASGSPKPSSTNAASSLSSQSSFGLGAALIAALALL